MPDHMTITEFLDWLAATFLILGGFAFFLAVAAGVGRFFELFAERDER